jgi:hypothetical protein
MLTPITCHTARPNIMLLAACWHSVNHCRHSVDNRESSLDPPQQRETEFCGAVPTWIDRNHCRAGFRVGCLAVRPSSIVRRSLPVLMMTKAILARSWNGRAAIYLHHQRIGRNGFLFRMISFVQVSRLSRRLLVVRIVSLVASFHERKPRKSSVVCITTKAGRLAASTS